ncbi:MAG: zinc-dependent alcohol dehydrogenase [Planctomycetota bacterium]|jgi:threonine dehydrogenase-like Zn-dependent dehydrogenase
MKAAFKSIDGSITLKDIESRPCENDDIKVRVEACGICGTDLHPAKKESQFGHEVAGEVIEVGPAALRCKVGDKVVLDSATPCGACVNCKNAKPELCKKLKSFFCLKSFGFAEEIMVPDICANFYEGISPAVASLQEPLGVAIDVFKLCDVTNDSNVLIMGAGPIGLFAAQLAKNTTTGKVFVSDFADRTGRKAYAAKIGVDGYIDPTETKLEEYDFGCLIDRIIVTSPPATLPSAFATAATGAIISFIGIGGEGKEGCYMDFDSFHFKKLQPHSTAHSQ